MEKNELVNFTQEDYLQMMQDTSQLIASHQVSNLSASAIAAQQSNSLANNVEFWNWMQRNYSKSGIFNSTEAMQQYVAQNHNNEVWMLKQLQGKDYEWSWMSQQRGEIKNIFNRYDAGDVANRAASDVTETNMLTGIKKEYQMKAYTSKTNPHLDNTPKDMTVVTNAEKISSVEAQGYLDVEQYGTTAEIERARDARMEQIKNGTASTTYTLSNVVGTVAKAGAIGCVVGAGVETVVSYKKWKSGQLSDTQYLKEIMKSGGNSGITSGTTAGIMIPVTKVITAAGMSSLISIPVAFAVGAAVDYVVAPCFGKGKYQKILGEAKYYQSMERVYNDMLSSMELAADHYYEFVSGMSKQQAINNALKQKSMELNKSLKDIYDAI